MDNYSQFSKSNRLLHLHLAGNMQQYAQIKILQPENTLQQFPENTVQQCPVGEYSGIHQQKFCSPEKRSSLSKANARRSNRVPVEGQRLLQ
jgi:hypothetical protein